MTPRTSMLVRALAVLAMVLYVPVCGCWAAQTGAWLGGAPAHGCDHHDGDCPGHDDHHGHDCECTKVTPRMAPLGVDPAAAAKPVLLVAVLDIAPAALAQTAAAWPAESGPAGPRGAPTLLRLRCALTI